MSARQLCCYVRGMLMDAQTEPEEAERLDELLSGHSDDDEWDVAALDQEQRLMAILEAGGEIG